MGWLEQGPGYTVRDLVYWSGFIGGVLLAYLVFFHAVETYQLVRVIGMLVCGVASGFLCELTYRKVTRNPPKDGQDGPPSGF